MKKLVILTGAGMSAESGISTYRDSGGLWEKYPVEQVASHDGWLANPELVNKFYNDRRKQYMHCQPNRGHELLVTLEHNYDVNIITQNIDDLHERAGSSKVLHLHGEIMKVTSSADPDNPRYIRTLPADNPVVEPGEKADDGSLLRPYIVFFQEAVPAIGRAVELVGEADILVIIGTSLNVYPAAGLVDYLRPGVPVYLIDPNAVKFSGRTKFTFIQKGASAGVFDLIQMLHSQAD